MRMGGTQNPSKNQTKVKKYLYAPFGRYIDEGLEYGLIDKMTDRPRPRSGPVRSCYYLAN